MAVKLKTIKLQTDKLPPIMFGEDSLNVEFYLNVYTPRFEEESQRRRNSGVETTAGEALGMMVVPLIAKWDLSDDFEVGTMVTIEEPMVNLGSDDEPQYVAPTINDWRFYYVDPKTHRLVEDAREAIVSTNLMANTCTIKRFVADINAAGEPKTKEHIVPISVTGLSNIPMIVMTELLRKVGDAMTPGEAKSSSSEESSFTDDQ